MAVVAIMAVVVALAVIVVQAVVAIQTVVEKNRAVTKAVRRTDHFIVWAKTTPATIAHIAHTTFIATIAINVENSNLNMHNIWEKICFMFWG